ncbi:VCBS repeat-containing protein [Bradyrhizobium niftali]|uniref:beta strand repeat-containing protein n=1 Tax=Bradyrhizobium niftali TaxID=2560055 RepID=UPI003833B015
MATQTTGGGSTTSFSNTPQAKDDIFTSGVTAAGVSISLTEDNLQPVFFDVMGNDLGGNAKTLFSIDNGINNSGAMSGYIAADLLTQDTARIEGTSSDTSLNGAKIWITADGKVGYDASALSAQINALSAGEFFTDSFIYAIRLGNGTLSWATATVKIAGVNDGPVAVADANAVKEDTAPNPVSGNVLTNDTDVDASDTHSVTAVNGSAAKVGTDVAGTYGTLHLNANGTYTYTLNNAQANVQAIADGQQVFDTFTYTNSDNHGGSGTGTLTITVTGTNDVVSITSGAQSGAVVEDAPTTPDPSDSLSAAGTINFTDVDLSDGHTATFVAAPANTTALGTFSLDPVSEAANAANGSVQWHYALNNSTAQYLAAGQSVVEHYTVTVNDGHGSTTTQDVAITITGTNDVVSITSGAQSGAVVEDAPTTPDPSDSLSAAGTINFTDVDLSDGHTATFVAAPANTTALGTFSLDPVSEAANAANGSVQWHYALNNSTAQYLAAGQSVVEHYTVTVNDGHGSTTTQDVAITITGTNDVVSITSGAQSGAVVEDAPTTPDPSDSLSAAGTINFTDVDLSDGHTATFVAAPANTTALGTFSLDPVSEAANAANGSVQWHYALNNSTAQYLAAGQSVVEHYTVTVSDGHSSTTTQDVAITITGTNDVVSITSGAQSGAVVEDAPTTPSPSDSLNANGTISFTDVDLSDGHTVSFAAAAGNTTSLGTFALGAVSEAANAANGSVGWTYALNNSASQYLADGQSVTETYTVTVNDGHGSTTTQNVVMTITGTNDAATVSSDSKSVTEGDTAAALNTSGQLTITDPDSGEAHVVAQTNAAGTYGDFSIDADGAWTYTGNGAHNELTAGQVVTDTFTVTSQDGTATGTVTVTITGTNDAATVSSDSKSVTEGDTAAALNTSGQLTITDPDSGEAHVVAQTNAAGTYGDFSIDADGAWTYTGNGAHNELTAGQVVTDTFTVTSQDGTATGTVTVTITGTNDAATVSSDSKSVTEGDTAAALNTSGQLTITDPDSGEAHVVAQTNAAGTYGDFSIDADGAWTYTGNGAHNELTAGQVVTDTFTVTSQDGTATGTVTVTITGTNDAATVSSDSKSVTEGDTAAALNTSGQLTITDPDSGEAHVVAQTNAAGTYGDFSIDADGAWTYTGNGAHNELTAGQVVTDTFTVTSQDGTATGTVTVTITGTNDAATVSSDSKSVTEGDTAAALNTSGQLTITDPDSGEAHVVAQTNAAGTYGDFSIDADGAWTYTGNGAHNELTAGQVVTDTFTVTSQDGTATGTVTVTITGTNDAATVSSDSKSVTEGDTAAALNTSGQLTITDPDSGEAHVVAQTNAAGTYGDFSIDADGAWTYTGNGAHNELTAGQVVTDTFTVTSQDGTATGTVTVTITGTNDAATVSSDSKSVTEGDTAAALNTSGQLTITDPDSGEAHVVAQTNAAGTYGDFSIDADGAWTYTGNGAHNELTAGQVVTDTFTVTSQDGTATGTVTVTITGTNDAATVSSDSKSVTEGDTAAALNTSGQLTITDPDSGEAHVVAQTNAAGTYGDFSIDADGAWTYTGNGAHNELTAGQVVTDTFTVTSQDGTATGTVTVTITGTNDAATVSSDSKSVTEGDTAAALNTSGQLTITDPDSGEAHVVAQTNAAGTYGDFSIDADGAWTYTGNGAHNELTAGQVVTDTFTVTSQDGTATGTVTVTITGTNDAATVSSDSKSVTEGDTAAALNTSGQLTITDPDSGEAHVVAQTNAAGTYGDFSIDADGAWTYTGNGAHNELTAGQVVTDTFTVTSQDGTATGTVTVTITGTNDAATVSSDSKSVTEGDTAAALNTSGQLTITDPDSGEAHVVAQTNAAGTYGDFSIDADGAWTYTGNGAHNELTAGLTRVKRVTDGAWTYTGNGAHNELTAGLTRVKRMWWRRPMRPAPMATSRSTRTAPGPTPATARTTN